MKPLAFALLAALVGCVLIILVWAGSWLTGFVKPTHFIEIVGISTIISAYLYRMLTKITNPQAFINVYLLTIAMKLVFFSGLLFVFRFLEPLTIAPNAVFLLIAYVVFTVLEVAVLFKRVSR